ncbi:MAG: TonB-dependent receptor [Candidatus Eremiobacteraeota bacterium]|nr:TonB-dependent receptor [Candidatus Eremiobacteraeota bacterium]
MTSRSVLYAFFSAVFFAAMGFNTVSAQTTPTPVPTPTPIPEIGHVFTSDRSDETLSNVVRTTYVVTASDIARRGFTSVADAIADLPGVNVFRYGATGSLASVGIRGSTSAQVLILFDGLPAAGQATGTLDLNSIPTAGVDRIEVVEGGGSTLYGAGSVGGIINVITHPLEGAPLARLSTGTFGDSEFRFQTRNVTIDRGVATNDYSYPGGVRTGADSQLSAARFIFAGQGGAWSTKFSGAFIAHHLGDPGTVPLGFTTPSREDSAISNLYANVTHHTRYAETTLELGASSQRFLFYCDNPADPNCFTPSQALTTDVRLGASLRNTLRFDRGKLIYGIDLARGVARLDDGASGTPLSTPPDITTNAYAQAALYAEGTWLYGSSNRAYLGLRAERDGGAGGIIAPSLGVLQRLSPALTLRANYATAFRAPSAEDLYFPGGFGNPQLQPERMRVADFRLNDVSLLGGAALTWFSSFTTNKIVPGANFVPENIGHASIQGLTFELRTPDVHRMYAHLNVTDLYRAVDTATNLRVSAAGPIFSVNALLGFRGTPQSVFESWGLIADTRGAQYYAFSPGPAPGYTRLDAFVRFRLAANRLLSLRLYNLANHRISDVPGYPEAGTALLIELATR